MLAEIEINGKVTSIFTVKIFITEQKSYNASTTQKSACNDDKEEMIKVCDGDKLNIFSH